MGRWYLTTSASVYSEWLCHPGLGGDDDGDCSGLGGDTVDVYEEM